MSTLLDIVAAAVDAGVDEFEVTDSAGRSWTVEMGPRMGPDGEKVSHDDH